MKRIELHPTSVLLLVTYDDQLLTSAAYAALDDNPTPRKLCIAGHQRDAFENAEICSQITGKPFNAKKVMSLWMLSNVISLLKIVAPGRKDEVQPIWQKLQYAHSLASGLCFIPKLDNDRYPIKFEDATPTIRKAYQEFEEKQRKKGYSDSGSIATTAAIGSAAALVAIGVWYIINKT